MAALERIFDLNIYDAEPSLEKQNGLGADSVRSDKDKHMRKNDAMAKIHR